MDPLKARAAHAARRVEKLKAQEPVELLRERPLYARAPRPFVPAGRVAELGEGDPAALALAALAEGAWGLSLWTERNFHGGDYSRLDAARRACPDAPLLMLDYVVDPWQLERARAGGADAVLLLPELLGPFAARLEAAARALGLTPVPGPL